MISIKCLSVFVIFYTLVSIDLTASRLIELEQFVEQDNGTQENTIDEVLVNVKNINIFLLENSEVIPMEMQSSVRGKINYTLGARIYGNSVYNVYLLLQ